MIINKIIQEINSIQPFDVLENEHIQETLEWIKSGALIFRTQKPDIPYNHLFSYFVVLDVLQKSKISNLIRGNVIASNGFSLTKYLLRNPTPI